MPPLQRILIVGATGFIGQQIIQQISKPDVAIVALCRNPHKLVCNTPNLYVIEGEATDRELVRNLLRKTDLVICAAGTVRGRCFDHFLTGNIVIPQTLGQLIQEVDPSIRFIHLSSLAARNPTVSDYAKSKCEGELAIVQSGLQRYHIIRPPAVYGPGDRELKPLFDWMQRGLLFYPGSKEARFSLLHVEDLCRYIVHIMEHWPQQNVMTEIDDGHENGYNWLQVADIGAEVFQNNIRIIPIPTAILRASARLNMLFSRLLGYAPMLTTGKVNELLEKDWVSAVNTAYPQDWKARISFRKGLYQLYGVPN